MAEKPLVTNVMRLLKQGHIAYAPLYYDLAGETFSGDAVCRALGADARRSFKTLCARGERQGVAVFVVPIAGELDLKCAAQALADKKVQLVHVKELPALTGYERGSVSPIGMKKKYPTFIDQSACEFELIRISGGQKGVSIELDPKALSAYLGARFFPLWPPVQA
ncbi:MAG: aminoacyl-tRNA deacylase, partial [Clostridia bacterium]